MHLDLPCNAFRSAFKKKNEKKKCKKKSSVTCSACRSIYKCVQADQRQSFLHSVHFLDIKGPCLQI